MATNKNIIDTGLVEFKLPFDRGTEKIYFNPNDIEFFIRLTDMINSISGMYDDLSDEYEKTEDNFEKLEIIRKLNGKIKDAFDIAFGNNVADTIFKYVSPHGIVAGNQYYSFYILDYLMPIIADVTGKTSQATNDALAKAMQKHGVKYQHKFNR
jgi:predicted DNA-binding protein YlxM (UPF0122 family)